MLFMKPFLKYEPLLKHEPFPFVHEPIHTKDKNYEPNF